MGMAKEQSGWHRFFQICTGIGALFAVVAGVYKGGVFLEAQFEAMVDRMVEARAGKKLEAMIKDKGVDLMKSDIEAIRKNERIILNNVSATLDHMREEIEKVKDQKALNKRRTLGDIDQMNKDLNKLREISDKISKDEKSPSESSAMRMPAMNGSKQISIPVIDEGPKAQGKKPQAP